MIEASQSSLHTLLNVSSKFKDYTGQRFNRLLVVKFSHWQVRDSGKRAAMWECLCDCGNTKAVRGSHLKAGTTISCGCAHMGRALGLAGTPIYNTYSSMIDRCLLETSDSYEYYGGKGITICDRWQEPDGAGFLNFYEDMGERPEGKSLDRIDSNLGYYKENCQWATSSYQIFNRGKSIKNTSGRTGVCWDSSESRWRAYIYKDKKYFRLGSYINFEDAVKAREKAEIEHYGFNRE